MSEIKDIVKIWLDQKVERVEFEFSCGGDSMNETSVHIYTKKNKEIDNDELVDYFDNQVYKEVDFYEASDGHYIGEYGIVEIRLEEDGEGEHFFSYDKQTTSEWEETYTEEIEIKLTDDEVKFIKEKVDNMNGTSYSDDFNINYKMDCIITDEEEELINNLINKIQKQSDEHEFSSSLGEPNDETRWTTNEDGDDIVIIDNLLSVEVNRTYLEQRQENE